MLNRILDSKDTTLVTYSNLNEEFFSDYKQEFNFINEHIKTYGRVPDKETFLSKFETFDLIKVDEPDKYLIDELYNDRNKRAMATTFNKVRDLLLQNKTNEAMALYNNAASELVKSKNITCTSIIHDRSRYDDFVKKSLDVNQAYVTTGFPELDKIIGGWDRNEEYATIVARASNGKTWTLIKSSVAAAEKGLNVGIYSGEMTVNKVAYRFDTLHGHIANSKLIHGGIEIQNEYKQYIDNLPNTIKGDVKVITPSDIGGPATISALQAFVEKEKLDILFIDQHSLLEDERHGKSPQERAANISRDIKNLQVMEHIPVITVSQQNRESTEEGLSTRLISNSDRIGQDSTVVIFVEHKDDVMTLSLVKSRDTENNKKIQYAVDLNRGIFKYIPNETSEENTQECIKLKEEFDMQPVEGDDVF